MKPRRLRDIAQALPTDQPHILAEGMELLAEHAIAMAEAAEGVREGQPDPLLGNSDLPPRERAARVLDAIVVEETGAFFVLADMARAAIGNQKTLVTLASRFTDHLAKGSTPTWRRTVSRPSLKPNGEPICCGRTVSRRPE